MKAMQNFECNLSFVLFYLFMLPVAYAQNKVPVLPVDGEYISEWLVLGPFFPYDLERDFLVNAGGEENGNPKEGNNRCLVKVSVGTGKWRFAMRAFPHNQPVLVQPKFVLSADVMKEETVLYNIQWKYHPGDKNEWAKSDLDDSSWELVYPELRANSLPKSG